MSLANICVTQKKKNLGKSRCIELPKLFKGGIWTPDNFALQTADYADAAALQTALQNLILNPYNTRGYKLPAFSGMDNNSEAAVYVDGALGRRPVRDGQYRFMPYISKNLCVHKALFSHRAKNEGRWFPLDLDNQLFGTEDADGSGKIRGFSLSLFWTEKLRLSDGTTETDSPIILDLADNEEVDARGILLDGSVVNLLEPLTDVSITLVGAFAAAGFSVEVKQSCDGTPVTGLLLADFILYAADGVATQVIQTATPDANIPGRYALVAPGGNLFESGSLTLRAAAALTVKAYEAEKALAVVIP